MSKIKEAVNGTWHRSVKFCLGSIGFGPNPQCSSIYRLGRRGLNIMGRQIKPRFSAATRDEVFTLMKGSDAGAKLVLDVQNESEGISHKMGRRF